jgi:DNA-binding NarL/FixJ family response regulator
VERMSVSEKAAVRDTCTVLVVDDQAPFRSAVRRLLATSPNLILVGEAERGEAAVPETAKLAADLVLMDVAMPGIGGIEATRALKAHRPETVVVLISTIPPDELTPEAALCGADEVLWKGHLTRKSLEAIWNRHQKRSDGA